MTLGGVNGGFWGDLKQTSMIYCTVLIIVCFGVGKWLRHLYWGPNMQWVRVPVLASSPAGAGSVMHSWSLCGAVGTARRRRLCETHGDMEPRGGLDCALAMSDQLTGVAVTLLCRPFQSSCVAPAVQLINDQLIHDYE